MPMIDRNALIPSSLSIRKMYPLLSNSAATQVANERVPKTCSRYFHLFTLPRYQGPPRLSEFVKRNRDGSRGCQNQGYEKASDTPRPSLNRDIISMIDSLK